MVEDWEVVKSAPEHVGVAPGIAKYESEYKTLALARGIKFKNQVSIGFNTIKIKKGTKVVVGLCTYGKNFREIDADINYWKINSDQTRRVLIFHEMTHCFCGRDHDYEENGKYPDPDTVKGKLKRIVQIVFRVEPGLLKDGCPMSIMYPYVLSDKCSLAHWDMYQKEMFDRCVPY